MAKKLIPTGYQINVLENTITLPGNILPERLLLITCINNNKILYNFADASAGITNYQFSEDTETTSFNMLLDLDDPAVGVEDDSLLQIFIEVDYAGIGFNDAMLDPVNKLRVSNPENLIDTDFEYGLQSSKWETLQTVLNIPTIYSTSGDVPLENLTSLNVSEGSKQVKIVLGADAELRLGDPIIVQGTTLKAAEGYFLISGVVDASTYFYEMDQTAATSTDISGSYTTVVPAKFFEGSNLPLALDVDNGIKTDEQNPSTITVKTNETHGLQINTKVYLRNTVGPKTLEITDPTIVAPDGRPYVDSTASLTFTNTVDATLSIGGGGALEFPVVTWDWEGTYTKYLASSDINITTNEITWASHGFEENAALVFQAQIRGQTNAGLDDGTVYYVSVVDADTIQLATDYGTLGNIVNLTALDISRGHPRLSLVYKVEGNEGNDRFTAFYSRNVLSNQTRSQSRNNFTNNNANTFTWNIQPGIGTGRVPIEGILYQITYNGNLNASTEYVDNTFTGRNYLGLGSGNVTYRLNPRNTSGSVNLSLDLTRCFFLSGSNYSITVTHDANAVVQFNKFGTPTNNYDLTYRIRMRSIPATMEAAHSGSDFLNGLGGLGGLGSRVYAFQARAFDGTYERTGDAFSNLASQKRNGRYGTGILRQNYNATTTSNLGFFSMNYSDTGREDFGASSEVFYGFANDLTSFRNTIYIQDHGFEDGQSATVTVTNYSSTNRFAFVDSNGNSVPIASDVFAATVSVISDNYIRLSVNQSPNTDDISEFPEEFVIDAEKDNELYNTIFVSNHKIVGSVIAEYSTTGTVIGGLTSGDTYALSYINDSRLIVKDAAVADNSNAVTTSSVGSTSNNANQSFDINVETPLGFDPANVTVTSVEYRGDFSQNNEFVVLEFADGSQYDIGRVGGQDTDQFRVDQNFAAKNISALLADVGGNKSFNVLVSPTNNVNFSPPGMSNWWELRFNVIGVAGDIVLSGTGSGLQTFAVNASEGAYDGVYKIKTVPDSKSFTLETDFEIPHRQYAFDASADVDQGQDFITLGVASPYTPHNLYPGEELLYNPQGGTDIYDTANIPNIYAVPLNEYQILLSNSYPSALAGTRIQLTPTGTAENQLLTTDSLVKLTAADGTVTAPINSKRLIGSGTRFLSDFKRSDIIWLESNGTIQKYDVDYITTDGEMYLTEALPAAVTAAVFYFQTQINLRPDGYSLHKSFDGGVDITAGTSPNSKIVRQTRKYFRYQSGKGIQNSFAINFSPAKTVASLTFSNTTGSNIVKCVCQEPHNLVLGDEIIMDGAVVTVGDNLYNGQHIITGIPDINTYEYEITDAMIQGKAAGFPEYSRASWRDSYVRVGMFDDQNGFFYEYDGDRIFCVRRSSTLQLSGTVNANRNSQVITGNLSSFTTQISAGETIVIRGQSYRVVEVSSDSRMVVQPAYRGVNARNIKITKTVDLRIPQEDWSVDPADGTGANGFNLDIHKLQMGYADYSWYGAGKIRFGFKDRDGKVVYMHEFKHNNRLNESYFRSGNLPGRYEIENGNNPSSAPTLFHFGTSVIMDGTFDDDKAYLFSAPSKPLVLSSGITGSFTSDAETTFSEITLNGERVFVYSIPCSASEASSVRVGQLIADATTSHLPDKTYVTQVIVSGVNSRVFTSYPATRLNPSTLNPIASGSTFNYGETVFGDDPVDLTRPIPLISIRLAPSVDSGLTGAVGEREIINRMQLALQAGGVTTNKDVEIFFILNGLPSNLSFEKVQVPSLSELISHDTGDVIQRGTTVFTTKASAGSVEIPLTDLIDMGNSIMGGDSVFPAGPDLMTLAVQPQDTSGISGTSPLILSGKISWSESQA